MYSSHPSLTTLSHEPRDKEVKYTIANYDTETGQKSPRWMYVHCSLSVKVLSCSFRNLELMIISISLSHLPKANGPDNISARMLKATASSIALSVTLLFNQSLKLGCFPTQVAIPKSKNYSSPSNYQPISLLPVLSKVLEQYVHHVLTDFLQTHHPISPLQWGFQAHMSTTTTLLNVTDHWLQKP